MTQCVLDANVTLTDIDTGFMMVDEGLKKLDIPEVIDGLKGILLSPLLSLSLLPSLFLLLSSSLHLPTSSWWTMASRSWIYLKGTSCSPLYSRSLLQPPFFLFSPSSLPSDVQMVDDCFMSMCTFFLFSIQLPSPSSLLRYPPSSSSLSDGLPPVIDAFQVYFLPILY